MLDLKEEGASLCQPVEADLLGYLGQGTAPPTAVCPEPSYLACFLTYNQSRQVTLLISFLLGLSGAPCITQQRREWRQTRISLLCISLEPEPPTVWALCGSQKASSTLLISKMGVEEGQSPPIPLSPDHPLSCMEFLIANAYQVRA